jgi:hypothetical protein
MLGIDRRRCHLFFVDEGMQEMVLETRVTQLIRLIGPRQLREPAVESVTELARPCLPFSIVHEIEYNQSMLAHACTEASEPSLPLFPTGDGAVHDAGHEEVVNSSWSDWNSKEVCLHEKGLQAFGHGLLRSDAQVLPVDIDAHDDKASLC